MKRKRIEPRNVLLAIMVSLLVGLSAYFFYPNSGTLTNEAVHDTQLAIPIEREDNDIIRVSMDDFALTSSVFADGEVIPVQFTCDGENTLPPLVVSGVPEAAESLVLLVDDPDIPEVVKKSRMIEKFDHFVLFNVPPTVTEITANNQVGIVGNNSAGEQTYRGPCPPPDHEPTTHRYVFQLYALDSELSLEVGATDAMVRDAMKGHILAKTELIGTYDRSNK